MQILRTFYLLRGAVLFRTIYYIQHIWLVQTYAGDTLGVRVYPEDATAGTA